MSKKEVRVDCHVHSRFSDDSIVPALHIDEGRQEQELSWVAITDHNTISEIAIDLKERSGKPFILGEEILTSRRNLRSQEIEIIGLFLQKSIESGLIISETAHRIADQGGVVVIPHPYETWRHGAGEEITREIVRGCSRLKIPVAIEVFNARAMRGRSNHRAMDLYHQLRAEGFPVLATAGSDAHRMPEIGRGYVGVPPFETKEEFVEALKQARIYGEVNALGTLYYRLMNKIEVIMDYSFFDLQATIAWERRGRRGY